MATLAAALALVSAGAAPLAACSVRHTACENSSRLPYPKFGNYPGEGTNSSAWVRYSLPGAPRTPAPEPYAEDFRLEQIPEDPLTATDNARAVKSGTGRNNGWNKGEQIGHHRLYPFFFEGTAPTFGLEVHATWGSTGGLRRFDFGTHQPPVPRDFIRETVARLEHPQACTDRATDDGKKWRAPARPEDLLDPETSPVASVIAQGKPQPISLVRKHQMDIKYSYRARATPDSPRSPLPPPQEPLSHPPPPRSPAPSSGLLSSGPPGRQPR